MLPLVSAQTIVKDIITGFFIIFEGQFDVSDYVQINASGVTIAEGTVKTIWFKINTYTIRYWRNLYIT